jgi:hypothetical protein
MDNEPGGRVQSADSSLFPGSSPIVLLTADSEQRHAEVAVAATRDHALIQRWAERHSAEPATGERTASGEGTVAVNDGGAGIRFNFPGAARFRPITWAEWLDNFETHELVFVYERDRTGQAQSYRYRLTKLDLLRGGTVLV